MGAVEAAAAGPTTIGGLVPVNIAQRSIPIPIRQHQKGNQNITQSVISGGVDPERKFTKLTTIKKLYVVKQKIYVQYTFQKH